jgi:hypothetical protein
MENKISKKRLELLSKKNIIFGAIGLLIIIAIVGGLLIIMQPQRTVANFCGTAKEEKSTFQANTDYSVLLGAFQKIDSVAPDNIHSDTTAVMNGYQTIVNDPSRTMSTELGIANSQLKVSSYITKNCPNY